jgi:hypothetical protein
MDKAGKGSGSGNNVNSDPFNQGGVPGASSGQYRNSSLADDYRKKAAEIKADANYTDLRIQALDRVINAARRTPNDTLNDRNVRYAIDSMSDYTYKSYGYLYKNTDSAYMYFTEQNSDKNAIMKNYVNPYDKNVSTIKNNNNTIAKNVREYNNNIGAANTNLENAETAKTAAEGKLQGAQSTYTQTQAELNRINGKDPLSDTSSAVKPAKSAMDKAEKHMSDTVGENAPLSKEKEKAQGVVDGINGSYQNDLGELNSRINGNAGKAQNLINTTRRNLGIQ